MFGKKMTSLKRIGAFLAAAALTVGLAFVPAMSRQVLASDMPDMDASYTLTVSPGEAAEKDSNVKVMAYVYKVADFDGETFAFTAGSDYADAKVDGKSFQAVLDNGQKLNKDTWKALGIAAGTEVLKKNLSPDKNQLINGSNTMSLGKNPGLYLIIACDAGKKVNDCAVKNGENPKEPLVTAAYTEKKTYYWVPQLLLVPSPENVEDGGPAMTSDGNWINDISVTLKPAVVDVPPETETESESVPPTTQPSTKTPPKPTPKTGDDTNLSRMLIMAGVSIVVLVMLGIYAVKRRKDQNK